MNERYTYGYNLGWNEENEYINSLNGIMDKYNDQMNKINKIDTSFKRLDNEAMRNYDISDDQIREWYNQDYAANNSLISFEQYKKNILNEKAKKDASLEQEMYQNSDEYFANLYYLIDIKTETRQAIHKRRNELQLLLSEKNIELSSISLEQRKTKIQYDENGNVINSEELQALRKKYDDCFLEIRKIEHALKTLEDMFKLVEFTQEETDLMIRGLNPQQRKIYEEIDKKPKKPEIDPEEPEIDPEKPEIDPEKPEIDPEEPEIDPEEPEIDPEEPTNEERLTLDEIIFKVCGDKKFTDGQSSRYAASKIKLFSKPQKDRLGNAYKVVSIPRKIIGIIPKVAMKVYGLFIKKSTKDMFKEMEARANALTDREVEVILNQFKGGNAQSKRLPKGFNNAIRPRIDLYVSKRVARINEDIKNNLLRINYCSKVITVLKGKLNEENTPEMIEKINNTLNMAYESGAASIKNLITLQIEGNNLQCGHGLHSFEEELKALDTKLNYVGGRYSKGREYDPELWSKISGFSHKIEYSRDPKEVVEAYLMRDQIYKENTKEKRSIFNLGSKVTAGKLDYRPFVESLNYGNDPFIRDLITSVLVVSSAASLINNITQNIKNQAAIEKFNEQQEIINDIRNNGETIEKGIAYDVRQTEGAIENMAERGVNDAHGWNLSGQSYKAEDLAHHMESANLSINNTNTILDLSSKYTAGQITHAEFIRGVQTLKEQTTQVYEANINNLGSYIEQYAQSHPQFDYTAVLSALKHAANNPMDSVELTDFIANIYERSINLGDLSAIESTLSSTSLVPDILTLGAVTAKVAEEEVATMKEPKVDSKRSKELRDLIESLKAMKQDLTEEEVKEIEQLITR